MLRVAFVLVLINLLLFSLGVFGDSLSVPDERVADTELRLPTAADSPDIPFAGNYRTSGWIKFGSAESHIKRPARAYQICLANNDQATDVCQFGAAVSRAQPCLAGGDCPAYESWEEVMGAPGIRPAPENRIRAAVWAGEPVEPAKDE